MYEAQVFWLAANVGFLEVAHGRERGEHIGVEIEKPRRRLLKIVKIHPANVLSPCPHTPRVSGAWSETK